MKQIIKSILPYGLVTALQNISRQKKRSEFERKIGKPTAGKRYDYEQNILLLEKLGCPIDQIRAGSMPEESLRLITNTIEKAFSEKPLLGLHVGNFVGISLAALSSCAKSLNKDSLIIGIDPNLPHRGIKNPQNHVARLLELNGLTKNALLIAAYSLQKSHSNDGTNYSGDYDPLANYHSESASENGLTNLEKIAGRKFDFLLIDGNHDEVYLSQELQIATRLLKKGGLLILDDVSEGWHGVREKFKNLSSDYIILAEDGRIGIAERR